jgi:hypothetical protein
MLTGTKSPNKVSRAGERSNIEKVKIYVEDLTVMSVNACFMRESMLKIEFRNMELEEANQKLLRDSQELAR